MLKNSTTKFQFFGNSECTFILWPYFFFFLVAIAIPNSPFIAVATYLELFRPLVNFDYILSALLMAAGYRIFGFCILIAAINYDVFTIIPQIFPAIAEPGDLLELAKFIFWAPWSYIITIIFTASLIVLLIVVFLVSGKRTDAKAGLVVMNVFLFVYLFHQVFMPNYYPNLSPGVRDGRLVSSQSINYLLYNEELSYKTTSHQPNVPYIGELSLWHRLPRKDFPEKALLIINESWGSALYPEINKAILQPIISRDSGFLDVKYGDVVFVGNTLQAELRELCSLKRSSLRESEGQFIDNFDNCLPKKLSGDGYSTFAMHAARGEMYDRKRWYPLVGFDEQTFYESKKWPTQCKSFPGACDLDMLDEIKNFFSTPGKKFMYWLTLNTHSWYDLDDLRIDVFDCNDMKITVNTSTCRNHKLQAQFFHALADLAKDPAMAGVTVRVIGDHPPPIASKSEHHRYFKTQSIEWLQFTIPHDNKISTSIFKDNLVVNANISPEIE